MPSSPNKLSRFWQELKRRNVVRVVTVYAGAAFVILELVSMSEEPFGLPDWTFVIAAVLLAIGFFIAIVISWIYDRNTEGEIVKTESAIGTKSEISSTSLKSWKIATYISLIIILGLVFLNIFRGNHGSKFDDSLEKSIAVLPFENWSYEEKHSHLGDAMADEVILQLQYISEFDRVISRTSTIRYKNSAQSIPEIGAELGVNYIIEGSIQPHEDMVSIKVQVIQCTMEDHIWAKEYNGKWSDIFIIQDNIAKEVAIELKAVLYPEDIDRIDKNPTVDIEAYNLYLLGRQHWNNRSKEDIIKSIEYYQKAIQLDKNYALAYSGLADAYWIAADWNHLDVDSSIKKAEEYALAAIHIDETLAEPFATLAGITHHFKRELELAEVLYKTAIHNNPSYASAYQWYAIDLSCSRKNDQAIEYMEKALELDPFSMIINFATCLIYYHAEDYESALNQINRTIELFPDMKNTWFIKFKCLLQKGEEMEALHAYEAHIENRDIHNEFREKVYLIHNNSGIKAALEYITELEENSESINYANLANLYALSGKKEKALDQIEFNFSNHITNYTYLYADPVFESLRSEPRYQQIVRYLKYED
jgi:TolB-like protein/Tfp pilus assembly protein PilF